MLRFKKDVKKLNKRYACFAKKIKVKNKVMLEWVNMIFTYFLGVYIDILNLGSDICEVFRVIYEIHS